MNKILNIWLQPIYARLNLDSKKSLYIVMSLFPITGQVIATLLFFFGSKGSDFPIFWYCFLFSMIALVVIVFFSWYVMLIQSIRLQYSPAVAGLVPQIRTYLQIAVGLPIVFVALLAAIIERITQHHFSLWPSFACVLFMLLSAMTIRTAWAVLGVILSLQVPTSLNAPNLKMIDQIMVESLGVSPAFVLSLAMPVLIYAGVIWTFSARGDILFKINIASLKRLAAFSGMKIDENRMSLGFASTFVRWMTFCVKRNQKALQSKNVGRKLFGFALGPHLHWTTTFIQTLVFAVLGTLLILLLRNIPKLNDSHFVLSFSPAVPTVFFIGLPLIFFLMLFQSLFFTRAEQGLFSLTEKSMASAMQNQALSNYLLRQLFILYALSIVAAFAIVKFWLEGDVKIGILILVVTCMFPLTLCIVRNHAKMKTANDHPMVKSLLLCVMIFAIGMVFVLGAPRFALFWYCALIFVSTLVLLFFKMKANARLRIFPVGRAA
jgi:hypothetical protein